MVSIQIQKAILKEKIGVVEDIHSFMKKKDVDDDVLSLIVEFQDLMKKKKGKVKNSMKKKSDGKKKPPTFWNNYLKENMPIVRAEQEGLDEDDDAWIEKEGRWEMKEVAKRWALFKEQDNFKDLEAEYKRKQKAASDSDEEVVSKKKSKETKKTKKSKSKKVSKIVPPVELENNNSDVDSDDDSDEEDNNVDVNMKDGNDSDDTSDSDNE